MTATAVRPEQPAKAAKGARSRQTTVLGGPIQVNLLPPEVEAKRALRHTKRWLAALFALALLVMAGVTVLGVLAQGDAEEELAFQRSETERLLLEQQQYAEVPLVLDQLQTLKDVREMGMSTEILWRERVAAIAATAPQGVSIDSITISAPGPMVGPALPANPLEAQSVASVAFTANSLTLPDTAAWLDALVAVPGYADPWFSTATIAEKEGVAYYSVTGTVQVSDAALAHRFVETEGEG